MLHKHAAVRKKREFHLCFDPLTVQLQTNCFCVRSPVTLCLLSVTVFLNTQGVIDMHLVIMKAFTWLSGTCSEKQELAYHCNRLQISSKFYSTCE